jgi:hypothetical protein
MGKNNYIDNKKMYAEFVEYKKLCQIAKKDKGDNPRIPDYIGECFLLLANNISHKPNFFNYTYKDEMISDGIENCILYAYNFNPKKSKNPFAYFTQIIYFAFIRRINKEKKQLYVKRKMIENSMFDDTLVNHDDSEGGTPSYIDLNNEKMNTMVKDYERTLKEKKEKIKLSKKKKKKLFGLDKFIDENKE